MLVTKHNKRASGPNATDANWAATLHNACEKPVGNQYLKVFNMRYAMPTLP